MKGFEVLFEQIQRKKQRRVATSLTVSGLPLGKALESFDFACQPRVERSAIELRLLCAYVRDRETCPPWERPGPARTT